MVRLFLAVGVGVLIAGAAFAQSDVITVIVPVAGDVIGAGQVRWKTSLELVNDTGSDVDVYVSLATDPDNIRGGTLAAGESMAYPDVLAEAFGLENALVPLMVRTAGRRSVTIRAVAYGVRGTEAIPPQPIAINYGPSYYPIRVLKGLSFSDDYRTNIGLVNLGEASAEFLLALQRIPGRNLAVTRVTLQPNALWHRSIQALFPAITAGENFSVVVETPSRQTYLYASVIENATNAARFIQPAIGTGPVR